MLHGVTNTGVAPHGLSFLYPRIAEKRPLKDLTPTDVVWKESGCRIEVFVRWWKCGGGCTESATLIQTSRLRFGLSRIPLSEFPFHMSCGNIKANFFRYLEVLR